MLDKNIFHTKFPRYFHCSSVSLQNIFENLHNYIGSIFLQAFSGIYPISYETAINCYPLHLPSTPYQLPGETLQIRQAIRTRFRPLIEMIKAVYLSVIQSDFGILTNHRHDSYLKCLGSMRT